jgi:hypothetical protein
MTQKYMITIKNPASRSHWKDGIERWRTAATLKHALQKAKRNKKFPVWIEAINQPATK